VARFVVDNSVIVAFGLAEQSPDADVLDLARSEGLSSYDASYLDLAIREHAALATLDERLRQAANLRGVPLLVAD
jgi:predicted nucleic acid-binding protein